MRAVAFAAILLLVPLPLARADPGLCTPADVADLVAVTCEEQTYANGQTQRATQIEVELDNWFVLRARFSENSGDLGTFSRCSVYYHSLGAPGPTSIEWGTAACPYVFGAAPNT